MPLPESLFRLSGRDLAGALLETVFRTVTSAVNNAASSYLVANNVFTVPAGRVLCISTFGGTVLSSTSTIKTCNLVISQPGGNTNIVLRAVNCGAIQAVANAPWDFQWSGAEVFCGPGCVLAFQSYFANVNVADTMTWDFSGYTFPVGQINTVA